MRKREPVALLLAAMALFLLLAGGLFAIESLMPGARETMLAGYKVTHGSPPPEILLSHPLLRSAIFIVFMIVPGFLIGLTAFLLWRSAQARERADRTRLAAIWNDGLPRRWMDGSAIWRRLGRGSRRPRWSSWG